MTWATDATQRYGAIAAGLLIGTAARYGLVLNEGRPITWRGVLADFLLLAIVGLLSTVVSDRIGLHGNERAFGAALAAISSDRLIKLIRARFEQVAEDKAGAMAKAASASDFAHMPAGEGTPNHMRVESAAGQPLYASSLRKNYRHIAAKRPLEDQIELLRQLPDDPPQE